MEARTQLRFRKLEAGARSPARLSPNTFALCSAEKAIITANRQAAISTGLAVQLPPGCFLQLSTPTDGKARDGCVEVGAGVVDSDYRGEVKVILLNHGANELLVEQGDRVALAAVCFCPAVAALPLEPPPHVPEPRRPKKNKLT